MISGIVYWEEVVASLKGELGIENLGNREDYLRTILLDAEIDIAPGACIVRKQRDYTIGDGFYDGTYIMMPADFTGDYYYSQLNTAEYYGDRLKLKELPGPDTVTLRYMGFLFDSKGNPVTSRNHKDAVVARMCWKMYASRVFLGKGDKQQLAKYKSDYETLVMASRGNDAAASYEGYALIGETLRMSKFDLHNANCGAMMVEDRSFIEGGTPAVGGGDGGDCGDLTVDMIAVFESNLTT